MLSSGSLKLTFQFLNLNEYNNNCKMEELLELMYLEEITRDDEEHINWIIVILMRYTS